MNPTTDDYNWWAFGTNIQPFEFSRMPACYPAPSPENLLGPNSTSDLALFADNLGHQSPSSVATLDSGDAILQSLYLANPFLDEDFDREWRVVGAAIDIGADELPFVPPSFRRGDTNGDVSIDVADAVFLLNALFVPGAPSLNCNQAGDVNDDEITNIADVVFLLNALFVPGSPPPSPPYPGCGIDPTAGSLTCLAAPCP